MAGLKQILKKQGGIGLLKQYFHSGALGTAVGQFFLLGKDRTALEILRLSAQFKGKKKLYKRYKHALTRFDETRDTSLPHTESDRVWVCWFQGIENAPELVQKCYQSLLENLPSRKITLITAENMADYVNFPDYILEKWKAGIITNTHMTDLLRLELLIRYGGIWLDATVLCTRPEAQIPEYFFHSDLFFYQCLKPGRDGHSHLCSSWLISAKTNNQILMATRHLCYTYWQKENKMLDYFLLHDFLSICLEHYPALWNAVVPCSNATPHTLLLRLFEPYDENMWNAIQDMTPFHKLTYKFDPKDPLIENTYYAHLFGAKNNQ